MYQFYRSLHNIESSYKLRIVYYSDPLSRIHDKVK